MKRKERKKVKKLHLKYESKIVLEKERVNTLECEVKSANNKLTLYKSLCTFKKSEVTSSFKSIIQIATGPLLSRKSKDNKKKLGQLLSGLPRFKTNDVDEIGNHIIGQGQFGELTVVKLKKLDTIVACKKLKPEYSSQNDVFGEVITGLTLSGAKYFPYVYGLLNDFSILMEYFGELTPTGPDACPNLWQRIKKKPSHLELKAMLSDVVNAVIYLHDEKILHNDLKADNFILAKDCVKLIDFGKATLLTSPKIYSIPLGSDLAKRYNKYHRHLAYELRNIPGSKQSILTDTFSLGYMFKHMAAIVCCDEIVSLGKHMKVKEPEFRTPLKKALQVLHKLKA